MKYQLFVQKNVRKPVSFTCCTLMLLLAGCSGYSATGGPGRLVPVALTTEVFTPYDFSQVRDVVLLPIRGAALNRQPELVASELNSRLIRILDLHTSLAIRNTTESEMVSSALAELKQDSLLARAIELNRILDSDGVFYASVSKYVTEDRIRSQPAAVAFRVWFLPRGAAKAAWEATYKFSEQPLSENLFRMKQALEDGLRYKSTMQLSERGFRALAKEFEILRISSEQS